MTEATDRAKLEQEVIERAARDPQFRQDLIRDPHGTMDREYGIKVPDRIQMTVLEETPSAVYLVLPPASLEAGAVLDDADLEAVAGGAYSDGCPKDTAWDNNTQPLFRICGSFPR